MKYIIFIAFIAYGCGNTDNAAQKNRETDEKIRPLIIERERKVDSLTNLGKTDEAVLVIREYKKRIDSVVQNSLKKE